MANQESVGWGLAILSLFVLAAAGELGLLAVLLPVSLVLGYGIARWTSKKSRLTVGLKKRQAKSASCDFCPKTMTTAGRPSCG